MDDNLTMLTCVNWCVVSGSLLGLRSFGSRITLGPRNAVTNPTHEHLRGCRFVEGQGICTFQASGMAPRVTAANNLRGVALLVTTHNNHYSHHSLLVSTNLRGETICVNFLLLVMCINDC